ncbi:MAG: hypothetical protein GY716_12875 [bacterium]|nr:hypothetical protein [bacterium]
MPNVPDRQQRGMALITVLLVMVMFFLLALTLLFRSSTEHVIATNEQDHLKTLAFAEAGLAWAERRVADASDFSDLLTGPDDSNTGDDNLIGLRDLSLSATSQFTTANEGTKSAIVSASLLGRASQTYEVVRLTDDDDTRALVYVRIDDNYDDDEEDPSNNAPLIDTDDHLTITVVAEYPVFVDANGAEVSNLSDDRGRAHRMISATIGGDISTPYPAIATNGSLDIGAGMTVCGDCGGIHANQDITRNSGGYICEDATASGNYSGSTSGVGGDSGGGRPLVNLPIINPYDDVFVPDKAVFEANTPMACPAGTAKYFALVADDDKGQVFKAYWSSSASRWEWKRIDVLDSSDVKLDDCGRAPGDSGYASGGTGAVSDGGKDEFYGFKGSSSESNDGCSGDASLSGATNNDFNRQGYYLPGGSHQNTISDSGIKALPGSFETDGSRDFRENKRIKDGTFDFGSDTIYSPLYGAVVFVYGNVMFSGNPGKSGSIDFNCSGAAGCSSSSNLPNDLWRVSVIATGDIQVSGQANLGPASPDEDFYYLLVAGRDITLNGNPQEDSSGCPSNCGSPLPSSIADMAGIYAAHEQIQISGNPNLFGFMIAEDATDCSDTVDAQGKGISTINGNPKIFRDCNHPPNPWETGGAGVELLSWQEIE